MKITTKQLNELMDFKRAADLATIAAEEKRAADYIAAAQRYQAIADTTRAALKEAANYYSDEQANLIIRQLKKHKHVAAISFDNNSLKLKTKVIFADIPSRTCLGVFQFTVPFGNNGYPIRGENLTFKGVGHWGFRDYGGSCGDVCVGTFAEEIRRAIKNGEVYQVVDILIHFLRDPQLNHSYLKPHVWAGNRGTKKAMQEIDALPATVTEEELAELVAASKLKPIESGRYPQAH